jgi:hypothetical protein
MDAAVRELHVHMAIPVQDILHRVVGIHCVPDDFGVRAYTGT